MFTFYTTSFSYAEYLFVEGSGNNRSKWTSFSSNEYLNLKNLLQKLAKSKVGKNLIFEANQKAKRAGLRLYDVISKGNGSLTDTTLIRKFTTGAPGDITYVRKSRVYINKELSQYDAILDLAHELTHYIYRKNFNPYELNFSLHEFIKNTIEGVGGEVQAFIMECRVHSELFPKIKSSRYNCHQIFDHKTKSFSYHKAIKQFYKVGNYFDSFNSLLHKHGIHHHFPDVKDEKATFISSAYGIPYPVAAFEEYISVLNKVCENDKRRIGYFKSNGGRSPASLSNLESTYIKKCSKSFN